MKVKVTLWIHKYISKGKSNGRSLYLPKILDKHQMKYGCTCIYIYIYMHNSREYVRKYIYMTINIMDISAGTSGHTFNNITADNFQLSEISLNGSKIYFLRLFMYIYRVPYH